MFIWQRKSGKVKHLSIRMNKLRLEMKDITQSKEQQKIKERQRQVTEKFEAISLECDPLRRETNLILQQNASTQIRLALMFRIMKARQNQELDKATQLTCALRELIARENQQRETNIVMQQRSSSQMRRDFMFQILKATENQEIDKAAQLTCAFREFMAREN